MMRLARRAVESVRSLPRRRPMLYNVATYAGLSALAEATTQAMENAFRGEGKKMDWCAVSRIGGVGGFLIGPALHGWYKLLDARLVGNAWGVVAKKVALDMTVVAIPLYSLFLIATSYLEGHPDVLLEWRQKFPVAYALALAFWIPAQAFNFAVLAPERRVVFVAALTFIELNVLCIVKRYKPSNGKEIAHLKPLKK